MRNAANGSPGAADFGAIAEIETPDDATVVIALARPNASLPMTLTNRFGCVVPRDTFARPEARARLSQQSVGTGPFRLAEFRPQSHIRMARASRSIGRRGSPIWRACCSACSRMLPACCRRCATVAPISHLLSAAAGCRTAADVPGLEIAAAPSLRQNSLDLDGNFAQLKDVRVRRAIALAIDKQAVMQAAIGTHGTVLGTTVAAMQDAWGAPLESLATQRPDLDQARALLAEAGLAGAFRSIWSASSGSSGWTPPPSPSPSSSRASASG